MAAGEILGEEAVIQEEAAIQEEGEEEIRAPRMTNYQDNNLRSSKEIGEDQKHSCKNGASIEASIALPRK